VVRIETVIHAPIERCFDLARDPDLHAHSLEHTGERVIARTGQGLLALGDEVTFEGRHFGMRQRLTARITRFEPPHLFEDRQVRGAFRSFSHLHTLRQTEAGTVMTDRFEYRAPLGPLGMLAERLFLSRYLHRLLTARAAFLTQRAERGITDCAERGTSPNA
jgi:ligand-binding SRPBCC domain-containing protein